MEANPKKISSYKKQKRGKIKSNPTHVKEKKSQNEETVRTNCGVRFPSDRSKTYPGKCLNCCRQEQWQTKGHHENPLPPAVATRQRPRFHLNALPHTHTHRLTEHSCFPVSLAAIQVIRLAHIHETGSEREQLSSNRENVLAHYRRRRPSVSPGAKPRHSTKKSAGVSVRARMWVLVIHPAAITSTVGLLNRRSSLSLWL